MQRYPRNNLPSGWHQFVPLSCWEGLDVTHYRIGDHDSSEHYSTLLNVSLAIQPPATCESLRWGKWWNTSLLPDSIVVMTPAREDRSRWQGTFEAMNIAVDTAWLQRLGFDISDLDTAHALILEDVGLKKMVQEIQLDARRGAPDGLMYSECLALSLLYRLRAVTTKRHGHIRGKGSTFQIERAIDYIHANLDRSLSISEVIRESSFSGDVYAFSRAFKERAGRSPHRYMLETRLEQAKHLLEGGRITITEVALRCGFTNPSHFSAAFRRLYGVAPTDCLRIGTYPRVCLDSASNLTRD